MSVKRGTKFTVAGSMKRMVVDSLSFNGRTLSFGVSHRGSNPCGETMRDRCDGRTMVCQSVSRSSILLSRSILHLWRSW